MQQYKSLQPNRRKRDEEPSNDDGWYSGLRASEAAKRRGASQGATDSLGGIDDDLRAAEEEQQHSRSVMDDNESLLGGQDDDAPQQSGISASAARAAKYRRTAAARRQTTSKDVNGGLANMETGAASGLNSLNYTGAGAGKGFGGFWTKKRVGVAGGATSILGLFVSLAMIGMTYLSGPFEFIHIAEIFEHAHMSQHEDSTNIRVGKIYRFLRKGGSLGETRLSWLGSKYHERIIGDLKSIGISPKYGALDIYQGFTIDTENPKSPYKGMTPEEASAKFQEDYGMKPSIGADGKLHIDATSYFKQSKSINIMLKHLGLGKAISIVRARYIKTFGWVTWKPLSIIDKKIATSAAKKLAAYKEKWKKIMTTGSEEGPIAVDSKNANEEENGKTQPISEEEKANAGNALKNPADTSSTLKNIAGGTTAKIAGGVATVAAIVCGLKAVNDNIGAIRYTQVVVPLIRIGLMTLTIAAQIKGGFQVDPDELQYLSKNFTQVQKETGDVLTWYETRQVQAAVGSPLGQDILAQNGTKALLVNQNVSWLAWTQSPLIGGLCSPAATIATGVISIGISVISGGLLNTLVGLGIGAFMAPIVIDKASHMLAGQAIDATVGANPGPTWGAEADEGTFLGANGIALGSGGVAMTKQQAAQARAASYEQDNAEFQSQSFMARMFDLHDYRSFTSRLADSMTPSLATNFGMMFRGAAHSVGNVMNLPFNLYASTVHADAATDASAYDYGLPTIGMSLQDQNNPIVADPFGNAEYVAKNLLDHNNDGGTPDYINKALDCFGVNITKGQDGWDVIPKKDVDIYDTKNYNTGDCAGPQINDKGQVVTTANISVQNPSQPIMAQTASTPLTASQAVDWLRIRFFIMDTGAMEGYTCAQFSDNDSCINDGMSQEAANANTNDPKQLAQDIMSNEGTKLSTNAKADLQAVADGKKITPSCPGAKPVSIDPILLTAISTLDDNYDFTIGGFVTGEPCGNDSRYALGRAADFTQLNGKNITWSGADLADDAQFATGAAAVLNNLMPNGSMLNGEPVNYPGIGVCHLSDIIPPPAGVNYYTHKCDRLVIDTGISPADAAALP